MKIREILLEYNKNYLKTNFEKTYEQKINKDHSLPKNTSFDEFLLKIESPLKQQNKFQIIDPYMKWIVEKYVNDGIRYFEDIHSKTIPALLTYDSLKRKNKLKPEHRDIGKIKSLNELLDILGEYSEENIKSGKEQDKEIEQKFYESGEAKLIYNDSEIKVIVPKTEKASCFFGRNTKWCTAATKGSNMFSEYAEKGDLYIVLIKKNNERYQFHFETNQYMDQEDEPINPRKLANIYPKLWSIFEPISKKLKNPIFIKDVTLDEIIEFITKNRKFSKTDYLDNFKYDVLNNLSEKDQERLLEIDPEYLKYITSEKIILDFMNKIDKNRDKMKIFYTKEFLNRNKDKTLPEKIQIKLAEIIPHDFLSKYKNPTKSAIITAFTNGEPYTILYIKDPSEEIKRIAITINPESISYINNPSEELQLLAVNRDPETIFRIENPTEKVQLLAIEKDPMLYYQIKNPTKKAKELLLQKMIPKK